MFVFVFVFCLYFGSLLKAGTVSRNDTMLRKFLNVRKRLVTYVMIVIHIECVRMFLKKQKNV